MKSTAAEIETNRRPLRVLMVHYRDAANGGGSLRVGETIANAVDPRRVDAHLVFAYGDSGPVAKNARVPAHFIGARGPKDPAAWIRGRALIRRLKPDVIHFQDGVVWLRTALAGTSYRKIVHVHARYERSAEPAGRNHPYVATATWRAFLRGTDAQVCISKAAREALLLNGWIAPQKSYVVYNSIDVDRFANRPAQQAARARLGLPENVLLLGMICRLVWEKGCGDLVSVIERLPEKWHGLICGDGPQRAELENLVRDRGLAGRIHFIGSHNDVLPVYAALDAYAFLSRYEPFGLVLAEAMAAKVPVFGIFGDGEFDEPEYPLVREDLVQMVRFKRGGDYDLPVPVNVLDDLAGNLSAYAADPESFQPMVARAHRWVKTCFDASVQAEAMCRVYEQVCGASGSAEQLSESYVAKRREAEALLRLGEHPVSMAVNA